MLPVTAIVALCLTAMPLPQTRSEPQSTSWVDKIVIVAGATKEIGALNERGELVPPMTALTGLDYRVYAERGNFVQLKTREVVSGWIDKKDVVLVEDAVAYFTKRLDQNPEDLEGLNHRGWAWAMKGEYLAGVKDMTEAIRINPETTYYNNRARIWGLKGDHDKALADYDVAIQMGPQSYLPHFNRGNCLHLKKEYDRAIADFDRALQLNPTFAMAFRSRGVSWQAKGDLDRAIADYTEALRIDPKLAAALADRGNAWLAKDNLDEARADLDEAVRIDPKHEPAYYYCGCLHHREKAYDKALAEFAEAIRLKPLYALAFQERAATFRKLKRYGKALADLEHARRLDEKNADLAAALALFLASCPDPKLRDGKRAFQLAQQAMELERLNRHAMSALAAAHAELGEFDRAVRWQERSLGVLSPESASAPDRRLELYRNKQPFRQE